MEFAVDGRTRPITVGNPSPYRYCCNEVGSLMLILDAGYPMTSFSLFENHVISSKRREMSSSNEKHPAGPAPNSEP